MKKLLDHMKRVAKDDVRTYFAPFRGAYLAIKKELNRSPHEIDRKSDAKCDLASERGTGQR
jgi:hypothetical protein